MPLDFDALVLGPCHATFGEVNQGYPCPVYTPFGVSARYPIDGVFRIESLDVLGLSDAPPISTRKPILDIRASQVPVNVSIDPDATFIVRGVTYAVTDVKPDGNGLLSVTLVEA